MGGGRLLFVHTGHSGSSFKYNNRTRTPLAYPVGRRPSSSLSVYGDRDRRFFRLIAATQITGPPHGQSSRGRSAIVRVISLQQNNHRLDIFRMIEMAAAIIAVSSLNTIHSKRQIYNIFTRRRRNHTVPLTRALCIRQVLLIRFNSEISTLSVILVVNIFRFSIISIFYIYFSCTILFAVDHV